LFPEERVTRNSRFRKFIYQNGDIGNSDSQRDRPERMFSAMATKSRAACGRLEPFRQTMPT
jgi:hypothetical protein